MASNTPFFFESGSNEMFKDYTRLHNLVDSFDNDDHIKYSPEYFRSFFSNPEVSLLRDVILVRNQNRELIGSGAMFLSNDSHQANLVIQVHPKHRRQHIGTKIFESLFEKGIEREATEFTIRALSFRPYSIAFAKSLGFHLSHSYTKMRFDFTEPVKPALHPWGFKVRALNPRKELRLWATLENDLFKDTPGYEGCTPQLLESRIKHPGFDPNLVLVGEARNASIGLCVGRTLQAPVNQSKKKILQITGIGVLPDHRRKGYGSSLLVEEMNRAYLKGHTSAELLVLTSNTEAIALYRKHGFERKYEHLWYTYPGH